MRLVKGKISLSALDLNVKNLLNLQRWLEDEEVVRYGGFVKTMPQTIEHIKSYLEKLLNNPNVRLFGIYYKKAYIGNIRIDIDWLWGVGTISILIGEKSKWYMGIGTKAIELISDFAFNHLGLCKVEAGIIEGNQGSVKAFLNAGFKKEGILKGNRFCQGKRVDVILVGVECRARK